MLWLPAVLGSAHVPPTAWLAALLRAAPTPGLSTYRRQTSPHIADHGEFQPETTLLHHTATQPPVPARPHPAQGQSEPAFDIRCLSLKEEERRLLQSGPLKQPRMTVKRVSFHAGELVMGCRMENRESSLKWLARAAREFASLLWVSPRH